MKSRRVKSFRAALRELPKDVQKQVRKAYKQFEKDPSHPSLHFKLIRPKKRIYSVRIGIDYRALGVRDGDEIVWFWVGIHGDYDKLIDQL